MRFKSDALLSQYLTDLNRSQFISIGLPAALMPERLPSARFRQQPLTEFDIGLLDFLSLQQCDVGAVAGKKNSILGKVMPDSQRFLYELDIIRAIESCEIDDEELAEDLYQVAQQKRVELPKAFANAIFNGEESSAFFSLSNGFIPLNYAVTEQQALLDALNRLVSIGERLDSLPTLDNAVFEQDLKALMDSEYAGRLLYTLTQLTQYLSLVAESLNTLTRDQCGAPTVYLKQQFEVHYVDIIQPYMGRINQSAYQVLPLLNRLYELSAPMNGEMTQFFQQFSMSDSNAQWQSYQSASQYHAQQWSALFQRCSLAIGGSQ
ncbi:DUF3080 family protein [Marinomonas algarum]|uniref:DUF3080 domain-containing protein n=1 Tax=Marinomonas algarum TaxID=2883105 RepID=A0A9X1IKP8_9GAMM|nr:DUF3080 family protein [Marinomonas algarum]MCB5161043.1 DUF3080 domain-containing protein [Marinomonas algarum]